MDYNEDDVRDTRGVPFSYDHWYGGRPPNGDREFNERSRQREIAAAAERRRALPGWVSDLLDLFQ